MADKNQNFEIFQAEDVSLVVALTNDAGAPYGSTAGLTFTWVVTTTENSAAVLVTKSTSTGIINGTSQITITLADTDTAALAPGVYYHECRVVDGGGLTEVVFSGGMAILASTTG